MAGMTCGGQRFLLLPATTLTAAGDGIVLAGVAAAAADFASLVRVIPLLRPKEQEVIIGDEREAIASVEGAVRVFTTRDKVFFSLPKFFFQHKKIVSEERERKKNSTSPSKIFFPSKKKITIEKSGRQGARSPLFRPSLSKRTPHWRCVSYTSALSSSRSPSRQRNRRREGRWQATRGS